MAQAGDPIAFSHCLCCALLAVVLIVFGAFALPLEQTVAPSSIATKQKQLRHLLLPLLPLH